jgi:hypothetical protein
MKKSLCLLAVGFVVGVVVAWIVCDGPGVSQAQNRQFMRNSQVDERETNVRVKTLDAMEVTATTVIIFDSRGYEAGRLVAGPDGGVVVQKAPPPPQVQPRPPARRR